MIRITVELISAVHPSRSRVLGIAEIANDGETSRASNGARGSYTVRLSKRAPYTRQTWKAGRVEDFPRRRLGAWDLLYRALRATVGDRNHA